MVASVDQTIASTVGSASNSAHAWKLRHNTYANKSHTRIYSLRDQLSHINKDDKSITEYLHQIREIADELAAAGSPMVEAELTVKILNGLSSNYREVAAAICNRSIPIEYPELCEKLLDHELYLRNEAKSVSSAVQVVVANQVTSNARNNRSNRRSSTNNASYQQSPTYQQSPAFPQSQWRPNRGNQQNLWRPPSSTHLPMESLANCAINMVTLPLYAAADLIITFKPEQILFQLLKCLKNHGF